MARSQRPSRARSGRPPTTSPGARLAALLLNRLARIPGLRWLAVGLALLFGSTYAPDPLLGQLPAPVQTAIGTLAAGRDWLTGLGSGDHPPPGDLPRAPESFNLAKKALYEQIYPDRRLTFYCGCRYDDRKTVNLKSCGLTALKNIERARRVEAEHVFPAAQFGNYRRCWRDPADFKTCRAPDGKPLSGRECCERVDPVFRAAHNDLQNLYPAVGHINGQRSDFNWGMVSGGERFGHCGIRIDADSRRVQPPDAVRGEIARTMLYMRDTYGFRLSRQDEQLYRAWNNADPPDDWERERNRRIRAVQGRGNPYVERYARLD